MQHWKLGKWCNQAVRLIRYPPDRKEVFEELRQHVDDRSELFLTQGFSEEEAVERTLLAMGDADELAPQLAAIHKPFWGFAYSFTKWFTKIVIIALLLAVIATLFPRLWDGVVSWILDESEPSVSQKWDPFQSEEDPLMGTPIHCLLPQSRYQDSGYTIAITDAVFWKPQRESEKGCLFFKIGISTTSFFSVEPEFQEEFSARDSLGNRYVPGYLINDIPDHSGGVWGSTTKTGLFTWTFAGGIEQPIEKGVEWIDICYEHDGRDMALRIDLNGGNSK